MYISETLKPGLRDFAGQAVEVDATDVFQPVNPGDGLIRKYNWVGPAPEPHRFVTLEGLKLRAERNPAQSPSTVVIEILNDGTDSMNVYMGEIGVTLFGVRHLDSGFSPSEGRSEAVITRSHLTRSSGEWKKGDGFHAAYNADKDVPTRITLRPGASYRATLTFDASPGEYQFVFSYGGGVHEERSLLSNAISFDIPLEAAKPFAKH